MSSDRPFLTILIVTGNLIFLAAAVYKLSQGISILFDAYQFERSGTGQVVSASSLYRGMVLIYKWGLISLPMAVVTAGVFRMWRWSRTGHILFYLPACALLFPAGIIYYLVTFGLLLRHPVFRKIYGPTGPDKPSPAE